MLWFAFSDQVASSRSPLWCDCQVRSYAILKISRSHLRGDGGCRKCGDHDCLVDELIGETLKKKDLNKLIQKGNMLTARAKKADKLLISSKGQLK